MVKRFGAYAAIAAAWAVAYAAKEIFGVSDTWITIAVVAVIAIVILTQIESRLQAIEARVVHKDYSGIIAQLDGERHVPRHQQPESLIAGGAIASWIRPKHQTLFEDFRWFGAMLNRELADAWAIEELPKTDARGYDSPDIGRMYRVWYNACEVGRFQVTLGSGMLLRRDKSEDKRTACLELDLDYLRFIRYRDAHNFLYVLALFIGSFDQEDGEGSRSKARMLAADALGGHLWEAVRNPDLAPMFDFRIDGTYDLVRDQTGHWEKHGFDPMANGGDRDKGSD